MTEKETKTKTEDNAATCQRMSAPEARLQLEIAGQCPQRDTARAQDTGGTQPQPAIGGKARERAIGGNGGKREREAGKRTDGLLVVCCVLCCAMPRFVVTVKCRAFLW